MSKGLRIAKKTGLVIAGAATAASAAASAAVGVRSTRAMACALEEGLSVLRQLYIVTPVDTDPFSTIKLYGVVPFQVERYRVETVGNLCTMTVNMGLVQMSTFVLSPFDRDAPLLSLDFIYAFNKRKALVEVYDLALDSQLATYQNVVAKMQEVLDACGDMQNEELPEAWYDSLCPVRAQKVGSASQDEQFAALFGGLVRAYAESVKLLGPLEGEGRSRKIALVKDYANNLVNKGGVSTDVFKKALGEDVTREFFETVFFGLPE